MPATSRARRRVQWTGTIPAATRIRRATATGAGDGAVDQHGITVTFPARATRRSTPTFTFPITWTPANPTGDETAERRDPDVNVPDGPTRPTRRDARSARATAARRPRPSSRTTSRRAPTTCSRAASPTRRRRTTPARSRSRRSARSARHSLPSADAQGLAFSAAVPADPQRDEAEPLMEIRQAPATSTPAARPASRTAADYAQVSTDGGDQFHLLGTPPRGQQALGGGGDCALATGSTKNAQGNYQYAYAGLGALSGFATSTSPDNGHTHRRRAAPTHERRRRRRTARSPTGSG